MAPGGGVACIDHMDTVGRIYKEKNYTLLQTKYENSGPCGFGEEDFYVIPIVWLCELMTSPGLGPFLTPWEWLT